MEKQYYSTVKLFYVMLFVTGWLTLHLPSPPACLGSSHVCLLHISHSISIGLTQLQRLAGLILRASKGFYLVPGVLDETEIQRRFSQ